MADKKQEKENAETLPFQGLSTTSISLQNVSGPDPHHSNEDEDEEQDTSDRHILVRKDPGLGIINPSFQDTAPNNDAEFSAATGQAETAMSTSPGGAFNPDNFFNLETESAPGKAEPSGFAESFGQHFSALSSSRQVDPEEGASVGRHTHHPGSSSSSHGREQRSNFYGPEFDGLRRSNLRQPLSALSARRGRAGPGVGQPREGAHRPGIVTRNPPAESNSRRIQGIIIGPRGGLIISTPGPDARSGQPVPTRNIPVTVTTQVAARKGVHGARIACFLTFLVLFIISTVAGLIVHSKAKSDDGQVTETIHPVVNENPLQKARGPVFYAHFLFEEPWASSMSSTYGYAFRNLATKLQSMIHEVYGFSPLFRRFDYSTVIRLSKYDWNRVRVTSRLKMKDWIRTQAQPDPTARDLQLSFVKGYQNLLKSFTASASQKRFAAKLVISTLTVTTTSSSSSSSSIITTAKPPWRTTKTPAWRTTKTPAWRTTRTPAWWTTKAPVTWKPYTTAKPPDVPCGEVRVLPDLRIVGGSEAEKGVFPWMVMVLKDSLNIRQAFFCGGSILDRWNIITAAHCLESEPVNYLTGMVNTRRNKITVVAGKHWSNTSIRYSQEQRIPVRAGYKHSAFSNRPIKNDIAILRLSRPLQFNSRVTPVCLPDYNDPLPPLCVVAGWGSVNHEKQELPKALRSATLRSYNSSQCKETFGSTFSYKGLSLSYYLNPGVMCAANATFGGQDTCQGDSGGPLFCLQSGSGGDKHYTQFGVVSWGVGCGQPRDPGFYTYLPYYVSWIRTQALPRLDRNDASSQGTSTTCTTLSPVTDYKVRRCRAQLQLLRLDSGPGCSNLSAVVTCLMTELERYSYQCQWMEMYTAVFRTLSPSRRLQCQAATEEKWDAVCHNQTAVSSALSFCTKDVDCVSMLEVTLCVHARLDPRWLQCTREKLKKYIFKYLNHSLNVCEDYTVRTMTDGRQFMYLRGDWHVLCGDLWGHKEVKVACAQQGFKDGIPSFIRKTNENVYVTEHYNSSSDAKLAVKASGWLKVTCSGHESSLANCDLDFLRTTCPSHYLAASVCYNTTYSFTLSTQFPGAHYGFVRLNRDEREGHVCVPDLSTRAAHELCRAVGYVGGMVYSHSMAPPNHSLAVWKTEMECSDAVDVNGCVHGKWTFLPRGSGSCALAKVFCFKTSARLHNGLFNSTGIVQMYRPAQNGHDVTLKTVCRHSFDNVSAGVLCRQLGFSGESVSVGFNPFYKPNTEYLIVECKGSEARLEDCDVTERLWQVCTEPAVVNCSSEEHLPAAEASVRLSGPYSQVQVSLQGQWGTVCTDHWTDQEAAAICRQLGHLHGYRRFPPFEADPRRDWPHVLHSLRCGVKAASLEQCSFQPVTSDLCQHQPAAFVLCSNESKPVYTLPNSSFSQPDEGQVYVHYNGTSAPLHADAVTGATASALCRAMGYVTGEMLGNQTGGVARGQVWVWRRGTGCEDVEGCAHVQPQLLHCSPSSGARDYRCYRPAVSVHCYKSAARLHTGARATTGIVQLYRKGQWWDVCHDDITQSAANVICRDIMGSSTASAIILKDVYQQGAFPTVKATSYCDPNDANMTSSDCLVLDLNSTCASFNSDPAAVVCYDGRRPSSVISAWKLESGASNSRVLVLRYGVWGTVCDDTWQTNEARLLCRHQGYSSGNYVTKTLKHNPTTPLWAWSVSCSVYSSRINYCPALLTSVSKGSCRFNRDAMVNCYRSSSLDNLYG